MQKGQKYPVEPLSQEEINSLVLAARPSSMSGSRARAIIALLYRGALRISEALALEPKDVDDDGTIRVLRGKGSKQRTIRVDPNAMALVQMWMKDRSSHLREKGIHRAPLICTLLGGPVSDVYVRQLLRRLAKRAGIQKRVHPHGLRHSRAYEMHVKEGIPIVAIKAFLGHADVGATSVYLDHIAPAQTMAITSSSRWEVR